MPFITLYVYLIYFELLIFYKVLVFRYFVNLDCLLLCVNRIQDDFGYK